MLESELAYSYTLWLLFCLWLKGGGADEGPLIFLTMKISSLCIECAPIKDAINPQ